MPIIVSNLVGSTRFVSSLDYTISNFPILKVKDTIVDFALSFLLTR